MIDSLIGRLAQPANAAPARMQMIRRLARMDRCPDLQPPILLPHALVIARVVQIAAVLEIHRYFLAVAGSTEMATAWVNVA